jgi:phage-related protein
MSTAVRFCAEASGEAPVLDWLRELRQNDHQAYAKCVARIHLLAEQGHELRRPHADFLRDGVYELRARKGRVNYRILYFFHGRGVALLAHGFAKEGRVPDTDIDRALRRKKAYEDDPEAHTLEQELE